MDAADVTVMQGFRTGSALVRISAISDHLFRPSLVQITPKSNTGSLSRRLRGMQRRLFNSSKSSRGIVFGNGSTLPWLLVRRAFNCDTRGKAMDDG